MGRLLRVKPFRLFAKVTGHQFIAGVTFEIHPDTQIVGLVEDGKHWHFKGLGTIVKQNVVDAAVEVGAQIVRQIGIATIEELAMEFGSSHLRLDL